MEFLPKNGVFVIAFRTLLYHVFRLFYKVLSWKCFGQCLNTSFAKSAELHMQRISYSHTHPIQPPNKFIYRLGRLLPYVICGYVDRKRLMEYVYC